MVAVTWRELRRQNRYRAEFARLLAETSAALEGVDRTVRDFDRRGNSVLKALAIRIEQAHAVLGEMDGRAPAPPAPGCRGATAASQER